MDFTFRDCGPGRWLVWGPADLDCIGVVLEGNGYTAINNGKTIITGAKTRLEAAVALNEYVAREM